MRTGKAIIEIDPRAIKPLHEPRQPHLLDELAADMRENGWQGRPLLVISRRDGYHAWTGSHRIVAAIKAELEAVPCYALDEAALLPFGVDATWGHVEDRERFEILRKIGDETAIHLMWQENRC